MGRRRYNQVRGSLESQVVRGSVRTSNRLSPEKALILGALGFSIFYLILPAWMQSQIDSQVHSQFFPILEAAIGRRIRMAEIAGLGCLIASLIVAAYKSFTNESLGRNGVHGVGFVARFLARIFD